MSIKGQKKCCVKVGGRRRVLPTKWYFENDLQWAIEDECELQTGQKGRTTCVDNGDKGFIIKVKSRYTGKKNPVVAVFVTPTTDDKRADVEIVARRVNGPDYSVTHRITRKLAVGHHAALNRTVTLLARKIVSRVLYIGGMPAF